MAKATSPIPPGFHSLTPHLSVNGAARYIDFLTKAFGATEVSRAPGPGGKLMHALVKIGDSLFMLNDDFSAEFHMPPVVRGNLPFFINLYVPDVDAVYQRALEAGGTSEQEPANQFYGDRTAAVRDSAGIRWYIGTHVEDVAPAEMEKRAQAAMKQRQGA